ncbi:FAD-binding oxidoreductase [Rugosimonospora africana]|uniref:FAD-linked oxidase n=1 Tax=Rugosimonospora africana TaxID=556532 RepID=A0A8J3QNH4_9ACTN|nr:FAD-binding protein [Rugosimonospora africana]GIH14355.1 FAD-linked oxidase [Rugosimonospora africana]
MSQEQRNQLSRRRLLAGAGAVAAGSAGLAGAVDADKAEAAPAAPQATQAAGPEPAAFGPVTVRPGDLRYDNLVRGNNFRYVGRPDEIRVVGSTDQVVRAVSDAAHSGRRIAVRSGGHCFENFTADPAVRMLLDLSPMDAVGYDPGRHAFSVQPGATLGHVYRMLHKGWGVTIPAGGCPEVGAGGHIAGGGYGPLSRRYGSVVDHLYGVEVVVVDRDGTARAVVATREPDDPNHDLWWAHTGGGGGNFGVVTRYWLRSPGATGTDPSRLLPASPRKMRECLVVWTWNEQMTEQAFTTLLRNYGTWHERNSAPGSPYAGIYGVFLLSHKTAGSFELAIQVDADLPNADGMISDFVSAVTAGAGVDPVLNERRTRPWLHMVTWPGTGEPGDQISRRYKIKAGYLRRSLTDTQLATVYQHLTNATGGSDSGMLLIGYGGQVGAVPADSTATAQRDVVMKAVYQSIWTDPSQDAANLTWVREFYRDVYAATGGVPVPDEVSDGSYINYADADLADPAWNTSGVPWSTLYYKDNYPRLRQVKARWDPRNVFRHALAIEP